MSKALGLLSGGLDSSLAALTLRRQGVEVSCVAFVTPFFGAGRAQKAAHRMGIPLIVKNIGEVHLEMIKNPRYGYGSNLNPCIDCHAMMFRLAGAIMLEQGFDFLFSGEVLGQRPMSQNLSALKAVANYSGHPDRILRPLSAKLLPITPMEEAGLVDRARLLDIQGRTRKRQQALAKEWGLTEYPNSGGGCLLTEKSFTARLKDLLDHHPGASVVDAELLKLGRQYRLSPRAKLTLGRSQETNQAICALARCGDVLLHSKNFAGPVGLVYGRPTEADLAVAGAILAAYGKGQDQPQVEVELQQGEQCRTLQVTPLDRESIVALIIE